MPHNGDHLPLSEPDTTEVPVEPQAPSRERFTDPEELKEAIDLWQDRGWSFNAFGLALPISTAPFIVAGINPLSSQLFLDETVRKCCNISQRFPGVWGRSDQTWTGTACDLSAVRPERHHRNHVAESIITCLVVGTPLLGHEGHLFGTIGFHLAGTLPEPIPAEQAVRLLRAASEIWSADQKLRHND